MARGAYVFVALVYAILAASFVASTATLILEFKDHDWVSLALAHSHLFIFFPTFGIVVLAAFYRPSVIFTHLYWSQEQAVPFGKLRFLFGLAVAIGASWWVAQQIGGSDLRGIWEIQPAALERDQGGPMSCTAADGTVSTCRRVPFLKALDDTPDVRPQACRLRRLHAQLQPGPVARAPARVQGAAVLLPGRRPARYAAVLRRAEALCQRSEGSASRSAACARARRSSIKYFLPIKVFFIVVMVVIAALLAFWRRRIDVLYPDYVPSIERGIIIGGLAMLIWPLMDYAYLQTSMTLFGRTHGGLHFRWSLVIVPWAILLPFFFLRGLDKNRELIAQGASVLASFIAILRYPQINDFAVRVFGAGAEPWMFALIVGLSFDRVRRACSGAPSGPPGRGGGAAARR